MASQMVQGFIERVIASRPESGWCCFVVGKKKGGSTTCVGFFGGIRENLYVEITGEKVVHPTYGPQMKADSIEVRDPPDQLGVERFLTGVEDIGPETAESIVDHFGDDTMRVLREEPERLREVPGIGKLRARTLAEHFRELTASQETVLALMKKGLTASQAMKVTRQWGLKDSISRLEKNPYELVEIVGFGFQTVDRIAGVMGVTKRDPRRLNAGIDYVLSEWCRGGHCWQERDDLMQAACEKLRCLEDDLDEVMDEKVAAKKTLAVVRDGVYAARLWKAEARVSERIDYFSSGVSKLASAFNADRAFRSMGMEPTDEQRQAIESLKKYGIVIVTGWPGTGKTACSRALTAGAVQAGKLVGLCAPTGRAAKRIHELTGFKASTIHRLLEYSYAAGGFLRHANNRLPHDLIVVDESSMVCVWLMERLLSAVRDDAAIAILGDVDQLPSVGPGAVLRDVISSGEVPVIKFKTIHRQAAQSPIILAAHAINRANNGWKTLDYLRGLESPGFAVRVIDDQIEREESHRFVRSAIKDELYRLEEEGRDLNRDVQVMAPMKKGAIGVWALNEFVRDIVNPVDDRERNRNLGKYAVGDRVRHIKNNYRLMVFNGEIGRVISADLKELVVDYTDREVIYTNRDIEQLMLAFCITIHSAQGCEVPVNIVVMHSDHHIMLFRQLIYTAVTRASERCVLVGNKYGIGVAIHNQKIRERNTGLTEWLRGEFAREDAQGWKKEDYHYPEDWIVEEER